MWKPAPTSNDVLMHSRGPWKRHKYIKVVNGEYVYPGDSVKSNMDTIDTKKLHDANMRKVQAKKNAEKAQRQGMARTDATRRAADFATARRAVEAGRRNELNNRNLDAARNKAARVKKDQLIKNVFRETGRGIVRTAKEKDKQRLSRLRDQRNAEGRLAARKQIEAGNQRGRDEAARLRKLNAINTTRKAQRQGMARTEQVKAAEAARKKEALIRERGMERTKQLKKQNAAAATERSLEAARNKATRIKNEKRYKEQRNAAGRLSARKQIAEGNRKRQDQINKSVRKQGYMKKGDVYNSENTARRNKAYRQSLDFGQRVNDIKSIKNPTARKNQARALAEETFYKNVKRPINKAAKSVSAAAREAWNTASSYKDKFADFESFYKWYKKNVRK